MSDDDLPTSMRADGTVEVALEDLLARLEFDTDVPEAETAAAIASAVSAHVADSRRAAASETHPERETVDNWTFRSRLDRVGAPPRRCPNRVERGDEWRAAARSL
jgi:hypothetical protein